MKKEIGNKSTKRQPGGDAMPDLKLQAWEEVSKELLKVEERWSDLNKRYTTLTDEEKTLYRELANEYGKLKALKIKE